MALFLDSARLDEAKKAQSLGFIEGITTNPLRMQTVGRPPMEVLEELVDTFDGHVFYQLTAQTLEARIDEAWHAYDLRPDRVVVKIPSTTENLSFLRKVPEIEVAITMVFSPMQAYAAAVAGATHIIPYIGHAHAANIQIIPLLKSMKAILKDMPTEILAGDIQTLEQAQLALEAGVHHVSMPLSLILEMGNHDLTQQAITEYS